MNARSPGKGAPRGSSLRCGLGKRSSKGCLGPRCSGLEPQSQRPGAEGSGRTGPGTGPAFPPPRPCQARRVAGNAGRCRGLGRSSPRERTGARGSAGPPHAGEGWAQRPEPASSRERRPLSRRREAAGQERGRIPAGRRGGPSRSADTGKGNQGGLSAAKCAAPSGAKQGSRGREEGRV